jgi:xanthine dehydrogenase molybdopterin-binding subunit B
LRKLLSNADAGTKRLSRRTVVASRPGGAGVARFDEDGQNLTASFMDYAMPRATDLPMFATAISEVPSTTHPLGLRGGGEGGITPALGVIANAIVDGLREFGVTHVDLPATPERIWRAIRQAQTASYQPREGQDHAA